MWDFLFDAARFVRRGNCGEWEESMALLYATSSGLIAAAYLAFPLALILVHPSVQAMAESSRIRWAFAGSIFLCGMGHLEGVLAFGWPAYHLFAVWHGLTAIVSWYAVIILVNYRPR